MQTTSSAATDLSDRDIDQVVERAKILRAQCVHDGPGHVLRSIGASAAACGLALLLVVGAGSVSRHQALEKTAVIERLAMRLAQAPTVEPGTAQALSQLLRRPDYDCRQIACDGWIEARNAAARARLATILTTRSAPSTLAARQ
jgi:hypothetical protein